MTCSATSRLHYLTKANELWSALHSPTNSAIQLENEKMKEQAKIKRKSFEHAKKIITVSKKNAANRSSKKENTKSMVTEIGMRKMLVASALKNNYV